MFLMVAFVVLVVGCTVAITKDAQLTNQGFEALTKGEYSQAETFFVSGPGGKPGQSIRASESGGCLPEYESARKGERDV